MENTHLNRFLSKIFKKRTNRINNNMTVLICAAHPDDEVIGVGGTIAKISEKEDVISIIFSYGDKYPFWKESREVKTKRIAETRACEELLGIKKTYFMGLHDMEIKKGFDETLKKLKRIIEHYKPNTIFTHTITDGHPDHRAVHDLTVQAVKETFINTRILTFDINFFNFQKGLKVHYDITKTFDKKMQALNLIKSQHSIITLLKPLILLKAITYGIRSKNKYAECFTAL